MTEGKRVPELMPEQVGKLRVLHPARRNHRPDSFDRVVFVARKLPPESGQIESARGVVEVPRPCKDYGQSTMEAIRIERMRDQTQVFLAPGPIGHVKGSRVH